ncbi:MAG: hypothetical protein LBQ24_05995 [Candidatus Peribacteria bacterium]|nr:hypothetical protein [Candidatus Peribacteria bacterium]
MLATFFSVEFYCGSGFSLLQRFGSTGVCSVADVVVVVGVVLAFLIMVK